MMMQSNQFLARSRSRSANFLAASFLVVVFAGQLACVCLVGLPHALNAQLPIGVGPYEAIRLLQLGLLVLAGTGIAAMAVYGLRGSKRHRALRRIESLVGGSEREGTDSSAAGQPHGGRSHALAAFERLRKEVAEREVRIRRLIYWDALTGLPNRAQFMRSTGKAIVEALARGGQCHVLLLDLDRFKLVNGAFGHSAGDALLCDVARRFERVLEMPGGAIARLGGDEFAVLLGDADAQYSLNIAAALLKVLEKPLNVDDHAVDLGVSIGIAGFPRHGSDAETLLRRSEIAMYASKARSGEAVLYEPQLDCDSTHNLCLLGDLRRALERDEFRVLLQPKVNLASGELVGVEALLRWQHPVRGMVAPDQFIPFAEKTGFIRRLTGWMLEQTAALCCQMRETVQKVPMSVNLSTRDLTDPELLPRLERILAHYRLAPSAFCFEITESAMMDDPPRALQTMTMLHALGARLAIDDFGTGYSSLAYLKRLPVHELKIDKSFVINMERDGGDATIVRSTVDLAHNMGLQVVAEGIESQAAWGILARMGCDQGQGFLISRPMPARQFFDWVAERRAAPLLAQ
jgi:diguanylate cyclase (GGDEF)-like protein